MYLFSLPSEKLRTARYYYYPGKISTFSSYYYYPGILPNISYRTLGKSRILCEYLILEKVFVGREKVGGLVAAVWISDYGRPHFYQTRPAEGCPHKLIYQQVTRSQEREKGHADIVFGNFYTMGTLKNGEIYFLGNLSWKNSQ